MTFSLSRRVAALQEDPSCNVTSEQRQISEDVGLVDFATKCHQYLGFVEDYSTISRIVMDTVGGQWTMMDPNPLPNNL